MLEWLWNMVFPPKCPACSRYVEQRGEWCTACMDKVCRPHLLPLEREMGEIFSGGVWALGLYEGELRNILRCLKYQKRMDMVPYIHSFVAEAAQRIDNYKQGAMPVNGRAKGRFFQDMLVVPVPLHKKRYEQRGFNQSQLIFQQPLSSLGAVVDDCLLRTRETRPQYGLGAVQRRENLHQVFALADAKSVRGSRVLLVDDIMTTGATLLECGLVLQQAGAAEITGLVVASGRR